MQKIQQLVAAAVGLDTTRGDQLTVENVAFDEPVDEPVRRADAARARRRRRPELGRVRRSCSCVGLVALLFVLRPMVKGVFADAPPPPPPPTRAETQPLPRQLPRTIEEVESEIEARARRQGRRRSIANRRTPVLQQRRRQARIETSPRTRRG